MDGWSVIVLSNVSVNWVNGLRVCDPRDGPDTEKTGGWLLPFAMDSDALDGRVAGCCDPRNDFDVLDKWLDGLLGTVLLVMTPTSWMNGWTGGRVTGCCDPRDNSNALGGRAAGWAGYCLLGAVLLVMTPMPWMNGWMGDGFLGTELLVVNSMPWVNGWMVGWVTGCCDPRVGPRFTG